MKSSNSTRKYSLIFSYNNNINNKQFDILCAKTKKIPNLQREAIPYTLYILHYID